MKTFGLVVLVCLISWCALMVSIVFIDGSLHTRDLEIHNLNDRLDDLESQVESVSELIWIS